MLFSDSAVEMTGSLARRGASIRQSLGLGTKKYKQEPLEPVTEAMPLSEEQTEAVDTVLKLRDTYTLPEIPPMPLSGECETAWPISRQLAGVVNISVSDENVYECFRYLDWAKFLLQHYILSNLLY